MVAPLGEIHDAPRKPRRMDAQAQHVDRRLHEGRIHLADQRYERIVRGDQRPVPVDGERRIGIVAAQNEIHRLAHARKRRIVERAFRIDRREARRHKHDVAFAKGHVELLRQEQHHLAARLRAPGLEKAQMARGDLGLESEIHLAQAAALAPFAQEIAHMSVGGHGSGARCCHERTIARDAFIFHDLGGNRL